MPLIFSEDLAEWARWQRSQNNLRRLRHLGKNSADQSITFKLAIRGEFPQILIAVDATTPTAVAAFLEPLKHLDSVPVALLSTVDLSLYFSASETWQTFELTAEPSAELAVPQELQNLKLFFSGGHYLPAGKLADDWAKALDIRHAVAQHGLLTPYAPPLPQGAHALSFSEGDSEFWASGRSDVTSSVVGSQLLYKAALLPKASGIDGAPIFLGQLHGAELPRSISGGSAFDFCTKMNASYRPHPAEVDIQSRLTHKLWAWRGIDLELSTQPLREIGRPVVSVFSTGVLEAAAAGLPAWVYSNKKVAWVEEFWQRYNMSKWGSEPTPPPSVPDLEPSVAVANSLKSLI